MLKATVKMPRSLKRKLQTLEKQAHDLNKSSVYIGYYTDQGIHEPSKLSYVDLMKIHEFGVNFNNVNIPPRPVLNFTQDGGIFTSPDKIAIMKAFKGVFLKGLNVQKPLNSIGEYYQQKGKDIFGSTVLQPTQRGNDPLIETGDLKDKFSYRTSFTYKA